MPGVRGTRDPAPSRTQILTLSEVPIRNHIRSHILIQTLILDPKEILDLAPVEHQIPTTALVLN